MKYLHLNALFLLFVFHASCGQQQTEPHKDNIDYYIKDTVTSYGPNTMVRNVRQDRKGNILFAASWGGVFRYDTHLPDGQEKSFTKLTSKIGSRRYWNVLEDRRGNLWFTTTDSGVYKYNGKIFKHFTTREGLVSNSVIAVYEDKAGNIWFGGHGLSRYDRNHSPTGQARFQNFTTKDGLPGNDVRAIMEDKTGKLWITTGNRPCFYADSMGRKTFTVLKNNDGKTFKNVWSIAEDKKGHIWFGDADGLWRYDGSSCIKVSERGAYAIIEDKEGNIWTTGDVNPPLSQVWALSRYDHKTLYNKQPVVSEIIAGAPMDFLGLLEANDGSIWFGSGGGVHRYDGKIITDFRTKEDQKLRPYYQLK